MNAPVSRRDVLWGLGAVAGAALLRPLASHASAAVRPVAADDIRWGYSAITWNGNDVQAIEDIAALGFPGIQLRSNILQQFGERPSALRDLLRQHHLTMVALSSGNMRVDPVFEAEDLATHAKHAEFVRDVGGLYLQMIDTRPKGRPIVADDYRRLGRLLTELGKRAADIGIPLGYHNHMNSLGEKPEEVDAILEAADPRYLKLELDTAHYQQGGGDPVKAVEKYGDRLLFLHIKDLESPVRGAAGAAGPAYQFVELGRGKVDLKGVFAALDRGKFRGWAIVELDRVPDPSRTPKQCAEISKTYIEQQLNRKV